MPALEDAVVEDLTERLQTYLQKVGSYGPPGFLNSGGSAAVFKVEGPDGPRAFKAFDPRFLLGPLGAAERRRLNLQRTLIGHHCPHLVQVFRIEEAEGTAFTEMEFIPWPQLSKSLALIPDEEVAPLITQLVAVVRFLGIAGHYPQGHKAGEYPRIPGTLRN